MTSSVEMAEFFGRYATAFSHGDVEALCALFAKAFCLSSPSTMMMVSGTEKVRTVIRESLARYAGVGFARAKISRLNPTLYASDHALADLQWTLIDADGGDIASFDATYVLKKFSTDWRIVLVISHNEEQRLQPKA
jgi:hypothetical protein